MVGSWIPVQLIVTRPRRREAMRTSIFHTILQNLEDIQLVSMSLRQYVELFDLEIEIDGEGRNLMGIIKERSIYLDLSRREEGLVVFAIDMNFIDRIKEYIAAINGVDIELVDE